MIFERFQVPLAALTARAHQLKEYMEKLEEQLSSSDILSQIPSRTVLLVPPVPLSRPGQGDSANWPLSLGEVNMSIITDIFWICSANSKVKMLPDKPEKEYPISRI